MKSTIDYVVPLAEIQVPAKYLTIEIPSWEAVVAPILYQIARQFNEKHDPNFVLLDEHVLSLELPNVETVAQLKQHAMNLFQQHQIRQKFHQELLPYLLVYFAETSQVVLNSEELEAFELSYQERLTQVAESEGETLAEYVERVMGIQPAEQATQLAERASEEFIYKLIAQHLYEQSGQSLDELAYETFIMTNVLKTGADEIDIREQLSYESFKEWMPEMVFTQELFEYFEPQYKFVISQPH